MGKKLSGAIASSVAALAASAAKQKPQARATPRRGRKAPDPEQENAAPRPAAVDKDSGGREDREDGTAPEQAVAADQTRVFVSGLAADTQVGDLEDAFSDAGPVRHIKVAKGGKATVHFVLATDAARCVKDLQGVEIDGSALRLSLGESAEGAASAVGGNAPDTARSDKPVSANFTKLNTRLFRLVIRNLPFGIKEAAVRSAFETFGTLEEVHLPLKAGRDGKMQTRGFGFLQFSTRAEAKKALDEGNGLQLLGRPVAVDWAVAKEIYQEMVPPKKGEEAKDGKEGVEGKKRKKDEGDDPAAEKKGKRDTGVASTSGDKDDELGRTVFIRNIPLEAEEHEVRAVMNRFGKMVFCKLVIDKVTGKHKGTAFCQFVSPDAAQQACAAGGAFTGTDDWEEVQRKKDKRLQSSGAPKSAPNRP